MAQGSSDVGSQPPKATATAIDSPADCFDLQLHGTPDEPSIERLSRRSPAVVVATYKGLGEPFWDTRDRKRASIEEVNVGEAQILSPLKLEVDTTLKGETDLAHRAVFWGGTIGCDRFFTDLVPDLEVGSRYVVFLLPQTKSDGPTGNSWVLAAWIVSKSDEVQTALEGVRPLSQLADEITTGVVKPSATPGEEPPESYP